MPRYVQTAPALPDVYATDPVLRSWLQRLLGEDGLAAAEGPLKNLAADVMGPLRAAHADAEAHLPVLHQYDGWGDRVDRVEVSPGWERLRVAAAEHALVALPYLPDARATWGAGTRVVQHALLHLYGPESAVFTCPVAMADGAAALLSRSDVDSSVRDPWLGRLISTDPAVAVTSGQWMTESQGGSDISATTTVAVAGDEARHPLTAASTIGEWLSDPRGAEVLTEVFTRMATEGSGGMTAALTLDPAMLQMAASFPLSRMAMFPGSPFTPETLPGLVADANK